MTTQNIDLVFVCLHSFLFVLRTLRANSYGPAATVFMSFFDVFFASPVYLNVFRGAPNYSSFIGIQHAVSSENVQALYDLFVIVLSAVFVRWLKKEDSKKVVPMSIGPMQTVFLMALAYCPFVYVLLSGQLSLYSNFGAVLVSEELQSGEFHNSVVLLTSLSIIAFGLIVMSSRQNISRYYGFVLCVLPATAADVWLMGKRSIIAFVFLIVGLSLLDRHRHQLRLSHFVLGMLMVASVMLFSWRYQLALRPNTQADSEIAYTNYRIDMGRDHGLKLAIDDELNRSVTPILEYRMQSLLFVPTMPIPRAWWPNKPWPFAVYLTSAALGNPIRDWGWGLTTDLFGESVANMGLLGLFPCSWFFIWAIRRIDRTRDPVILLLGTLSVCSLLVVQFAALAIWHFSLIGYLLLKSVIRVSETFGIASQRSRTVQLDRSMRPRMR